jgi:protein SCO1
MKKIVLTVAIIILISIASGISFFLIRDANAKIPDDISLVTADGESYKFGNADKKIKLLEFVYANCPDICPTTTQKMVLLRKDLEDAGVFGKDVQFITITIDPYNDTPEVLQGYQEMFEIKNDGNWIFLTGDPNNVKADLEDIKTIGDQFKFQFRDPGNGFYVHTALSYLIDENNKFIKKFPMGEDFDKDEVFKKIMDEIK